MDKKTFTIFFSLNGTIDVEAPDVQTAKEYFQNNCVTDANIILSQKNIEIDDVVEN